MMFAALLEQNPDNPADRDDLVFVEPKVAHVIDHEVVNVATQVWTLCGRTSKQYSRTDQTPRLMPPCDACHEARQ